MNIYFKNSLYQIKFSIWLIAQNIEKKHHLKKSTTEIYSNKNATAEKWKISTESQLRTVVTAGAAAVGHITR